MIGYLSAGLERLPPADLRTGGGQTPNPALHRSAGAAGEGQARSTLGNAKRQFDWHG
jgi:hypothetical protein